MKYPLDETSYAETITQLVHHEKAQSEVIVALATLLEMAMDSSESAEDEWYKESENLFKDMHALRMWHESRRFNQSVLDSQMPELKAEPTIRAINPDEFGMAEEQGELSEEDLARHFKEKRKHKKEKEASKALDKMSLDEIESWERKQENATDIYKIKARVANLARGNNASLTRTGDILCNSYVHVLKALYDFADKIEDPNIRVQLIELIRNQEGMPGTIIAAAGAGVIEKDEKPKRRV
jgi:hypothetical protein